MRCSTDSCASIDAFSFRFSLDPIDDEVTQREHGCRELSPK